ncbi:MAG: M67 family metallopeptidase [Candidatus Latescibacterota bacterium]
MTLPLPDPVLEQVFGQAEAEYPSECCGVLTAAPDGNDVEVYPCRNLQDRLHAEDPEQHPRDARIAYFIDPQDLYRVLTGAERRGRRVAGFYHSHIDCDAYFSEEDRQRAMAWGEPAYPEAVYVVVSVRQRRVQGYACFAWDEAAARFAQIRPG